jgi:hypothetical protein
MLLIAFYITYINRKLLVLAGVYVACADIYRLTFSPPLQRQVCPLKNHLFGLSKRQVRALATALGAPAVLVEKAPTADLESDRPGLTDEEALGLSYNQIDDFLEGKPVSEEVEKKLIGIYLRTQHKRQPIPTIYD